MKTINKLLLILFASLAASSLIAQSDLSIGYRRAQTEIDTFVQKVEGGGDLTATVRTADGGYITVSQLDATSFLIRKIKVSGQKQWERKWSNIDSVRINGIAQTTDGGFVLAGQEGCDFYLDCGLVGGAILIKLTANGTVAWKKSVTSGFADYSYYFASVIPMSDGGVIATGGRPFRGRLLIERVTSTGDVVWRKNFGGRFVSSISSTATADNGLIVSFRVQPNPNTSVGHNVMKINHSGNVVWTKFLTGGVFDFQSNVGATADGGVILAGIGSNKLKVIVLNADGTLRWNAGYSTKVHGRLESVSSPTQTRDGGYVITGSIFDITVQKHSGFIAKIDSSGKVAFQNSFGNGLARAASPVFATSDGGFLLFGSSPVDTLSSDLLVFKVNADGIVPGCSLLQSLVPTTILPFGALKIGPAKNTTPVNDLLTETPGSGMTSVVTNHPVSTMCQ